MVRKESVWLDCSHRERTLEIHQSLLVWEYDCNCGQWAAFERLLGQTGKVTSAFYGVYNCYMLDGLEKGTDVHMGVQVKQSLR